MLKYNIEGNIDFYAELYKSLDQEENEHKTEEDNLCLISNEPLTEKYVQLLCGHKFNYIPLYLDVKTHKQLFNLMEATSSRLNVDEIRCPYCRKKQKGLLPYYHELGLKDHGVNFIDPNTKTHYYVSSNNKKKCEYLTPNPDYIAGKDNTDASNNSVIDEDDISNQPFVNCHYMGFQLNYNFGTKSGLGYLQGNDFGDTKCYCYHHKKIMVQKYKQEIKDKMQEEMNQIKLKKKEEIKALKEAEKQKKEEEKQKKKEEKQKKKNEAKNTTKNVVLGPSIIGIEPSQTEEPIETNESIYCIVILKSGTNKGKPCGSNVFSENMCKRHFSCK